MWAYAHIQRLLCSLTNFVSLAVYLNVAYAERICIIKLFGVREIILQEFSVTLGRHHLGSVRGATPKTHQGVLVLTRLADKRKSQGSIPG